ncbi:hypothetical protein P43SY_005260 [Pythium insidiosum]|uniref:TATA-box-binding protein n=1 Tax=Pythium insidiosum TaxID=114742 RepID=A0AAD5LIG9_PYTIN|nr:hypothetical protein P43SY_005260 [Pythium insidiosum]
MATPSSSMGVSALKPTPQTHASASVVSSPRVPELRIKNCVSSANLGMRFDLQSLALKSQRKAELIPKKSCLLMKLQNPRATAMLFANGKIVCSGADSEDGIKAAARKFTQLIQKLDHPGVNLIDFKIQNIVGTCDVGFRVLIEELSFAHSERCTYEPELYPALIYRLEKPKVRCLVFVSGKVVFTGTKDQRELHAACRAIYPILCEFRDAKLAYDVDVTGNGVVSTSQTDTIGDSRDEDEDMHDEDMHDDSQLDD